MKKTRLKERKHTPVDSGLALGSSAAHPFMKPVSSVIVFCTDRLLCMSRPCSCKVRGYRVLESIWSTVREIYHFPNTNDCSIFWTIFRIYTVPHNLQLVYSFTRSYAFAYMVNSGIPFLQLQMVKSNSFPRRSPCLSWWSNCWPIMPARGVLYLGAMFPSICFIFRVGHSKSLVKTFSQIIT